MDDFLYNLRNSSKKKSGDRRRKSFDGNPSANTRKNDREYLPDKGGSLGQGSTIGQLDRLEKYLSELIECVRSLEAVQQKRLMVEERFLASVERLFFQLERNHPTEMRPET